MNKPTAFIILLGALVALSFCSILVMAISTAVAMLINSLLGIKDTLASLPLIVVSNGIAMAITMLKIRWSERNGA